MSDQEPNPDRRKALVASLGASIATVSLMLREDKANASVLGEENVTLATILVQLKETYAHAKELKKEYYDKHIKAFNAQVRDINDTLKTTRDLFEATQTVKQWSKYLIDERNYAIDFVKKYFSGASDFNNLTLAEYDLRVSALAKILASQKEILDELEGIESMISTVEKDLDPKQREQIKDSKRFAVALSNSRMHSDQSEIKMEAIKMREESKLKTLEASQMDEKEKLSLKDSLNLAAIKDLLEVNNRLLITANDLKEVELRLLAERNIKSRYGDKAVTKSVSMSAMDDMGKGKWNHSPENMG